VADCIVIFGAAVRADGSASGSLRRRCENAAAAGQALGPQQPAPWYLATGGVGRHGPAEALVMRDVLVQLGVPAQRVLLETQARDTLQSVRLCTRLLRQHGDVDRVLVSSGSYHKLRCIWLFRVAGFACRAVPTASDRPHLGWAKWLRYVAKEFVATPWDLALLCAHKIGGSI
jgi:uncharacterized SAM-binding protein YcdF (DUF218 family)